jgi:hypothetical protein
METKLKSLDLETNIGSVTLSNGQSLDIPKLSMLKIIKVVKFLGIDGSRLYNQCRDILIDENLEDLEKFAVVLETLDEKQLVKIFSITLDLTEDEVLALDQNEMLEVLLEYVEKTNLKKTYSLIRQLMLKMFNKELPESMGDWLKQRQENQMKLLQMREQHLARINEDTNNS